MRKVRAENAGAGALADGDEHGGGGDDPPAQGAARGAVRGLRRRLRVECGEWVARAGERSCGAAVLVVERVGGKLACTSELRRERIDGCSRRLRVPLCAQENQLDDPFYEPACSGVFGGNCGKVSVPGGRLVAWLPRLYLVPLLALRLAKQRAAALPGHPLRPPTKDITQARYVVARIAGV